MSSVGFYFFDVGQGDCNYIEAGTLGTDDLVTILFDFGYKPTQYQGDNPPFVTLGLLVDRISEISGPNNQNLGYPYLDHLFISHPDEDHWNMLSTLVTTNLWANHWPAGTRLTIGQITFGGDASAYTTNASRTVQWNTIMGAIADDDNIDELEDLSHDEMLIDGSIDPSWSYLQILDIYLVSSNVPAKIGGATNPKSLVLMFQFDQYKILMMGDAEPPDIYDYLDEWYDADMTFLNCYALKLAHHGSKRGTPAANPDWAAVTSPTLAFVSGDKRWGHPYQDAITNIMSAGTISAAQLRHWYACSTNNVNLDYTSINTNNGIFPSLWYVVTQNTATANDNANVLHQNVQQGTYVGVSWLLQLFDNGNNPHIAFAPQNVWPGQAAVVT